MIKQKSYLVGTSLFLAISLLPVISGLFINDFLYLFYKFFIGLYLVVIGLLLNKLALNLKKFKKNVIMALFIHSLLLLHIFFLGLINGGIELIEFRNYLFFILSFLFTLSIFISINENDYFLINRIKNNFLLKLSIPFNYKLLGIFFILTLLCMYFSKTISFWPPLMNFNLQDRPDEMYRHSTTAFFALGAIFFTFLACALTNKIRIFILMIALLYFYISFLSGARGEFILGLLIINLILFKFLSVGQIILYLFSLSGLVAGILFYEIIDFSNYVMIQRLDPLLNRQSFSYRDVLFREVFELLWDRRDCALLGCGLNFFQIYHGYDLGMYPHNVFLELIITSGLLIAMSLILLTVFGCVLGYFTKYGNTFTFYVLLYYLGWSLKSGSIISITSIPVLLYFSYIGLRCIISISSNPLHMPRK
jgi:hypothetical protein